MSKNVSKVPWEPYKAACSSDIDTSNTNIKGLLNTTSTSSSSNIIKNDLIRYKTDTNLDVFNSQRPGYQFDDCDFKQIEENKQRPNENLNETFARQIVNQLNEKEFTSSADKLPPNFLDARFYTDYHFLKLANQLKKKTFETETPPPAPPLNNKVNSNTTPKPVNVVGPLIEKKSNESSNKNTNVASNYGADSESIKLWKTQRNQYESQISYLENQMKGIYEQLQIQTQVNAELKKMLVASIGGEDMQYKLERLINDKQRYEYELINITKDKEKLIEDLEQTRIQCDLWRSKFLGSKLMAEENSTWKSFLLMLNSQNEIVLKKLLDDNELLNSKLNQALEMLVKYKESKGLSVNQNPNHSKGKCLNSLQCVNVLLSNLGSFSQNSSSKPIESLSKKNNSHRIKSKTLNEIAAEQMLEQFDWLKAAVNNVENRNESEQENKDLNVIDSLDNLEKLITRIKFNRLTTLGRLFQVVNTSEMNLLLNVCNKCTGKIQIV